MKDLSPHLPAPAAAATHGAAAPASAATHGAAAPADAAAPTTAEAPAISVVVPAFNVEPYFDECLGSIQDQSFSDFEVIVVDDGSTDQTAAIAQRFANADVRFSLITQDNLHAGVARNAGMAQAQGGYLLFFDADDRMAPTMLEALHARAAETDADVVVCQSVSFDNQTGEELEEFFGPFDVDYAAVYSGVELGDNLFTSFIGWPWNKLFKASFVQLKGLAFQDLSSTNDAYFTYCALALAQRIALVEQTLVWHRKRAGSIETSRSASPHNAVMAYRAIVDRLSAEPGVWEALERSCINWGLGHLRWNFETLEGPAQTQAFQDYLDLLSGDQAIPDSMLRFEEERRVRAVLAQANTVPHEQLLAQLAIELLRTNWQREGFWKQLQDCWEYERQLNEQLDTVRVDLHNAHGWLDEAREDIGNLHAGIAERDATIGNQDAEIGRLADIEADLKARVSELEQSTTYKVGSAITALPRFVKDRMSRGADVQLASVVPAAGAQVVASLTSYPARIETTHIAIRSILAQEVVPRLVVLYLWEGEFPGREASLPQSLLELLGPTVKLRWVDCNLKPHKKYFYALQEFADDIVVTFDDDLEYRPQLIGELLAMHERFPDAVVASRTHLVRFNPDGTIAPYPQWHLEAPIENPSLVGVPSMRLFATNGAGSLFPPRLLPPQTFDADALCQTCLNADDVWLKVMEMIAGVPVVAATSQQGLTYIPGTQEQALCHDNLEADDNGNDRYLKACFERYAGDLARAPEAIIDDGALDALLPHPSP